MHLKLVSRQFHIGLLTVVVLNQNTPLAHEVLQFQINQRYNRLQTTVFWIAIHCTLIQIRIIFSLFHLFLYMI